MASTSRVAPPATSPRFHIPTPNITPTAEVVHSDAAVVRPWTENPSRKMTPAHRKPMPVRMPCDIRVGSITSL
ncbi:hypothetical protein D3C80_1471520 [compost metagenome]